MRRFLAFLVFSAICLFSSLTLFASKKDDKGGKDGKDGKGQEPIVITIFVWNGAWSPVMREAPMENPINTFQMTEETFEIL